VSFTCLKRSRSSMATAIVGGTLTVVPVFGDPVPFGKQPLGRSSARSQGWPHDAIRRSGHSLVPWSGSVG
jgi:hypothetical protein